MIRLIPDEVLALVAYEDPTLHERLRTLRQAIERAERGAAGRLVDLPATVLIDGACRAAEVIWGRRRILAVKLSPVSGDAPSAALMLFRSREEGWTSRDGHRLIVGRVMLAWPIEQNREVDEINAHLVGWEHGALGRSFDPTLTVHPHPSVRASYLRGLAEGQSARAQAIERARSIRPCAGDLAGR